MPHILTIADIASRHAYWSAPLDYGIAVEILALEAMGAVGLNVGAPSYAVVPWFEVAP